MLEEFTFGTRCLFLGFTWLTRPGIMRYVIWPLLITVLLFALATGLGAHYFGGWLDQRIAALPH